MNGAESTQKRARIHLEIAFLRRTVSVLASLALLGVVAGGCGGARQEIAAPEASMVGAVPEAPARVTAAEPVQVPPLGADQFRVCVFNFHSPDEIAAIKAALPEERFVFTDLSPVFPGGVGTAGSTLARKTPGWFMDRCRADLRCDVVIYSGEFAGAFFGSYGYFVTIQELEEAACQARCDGLFRDPREVFLLACNTLATKGADRRTPEEYLHVLLAHGYSHADAERVVAARYGPLGASFKESMRRAFVDVPRIYGFSSVAPIGQFTAPRLREYFRRKGDYAEYLTRVERKSVRNQELLNAFAGTGLVQTEGVGSGEAAGDRNLVCNLYDETMAVDERLMVVEKMFSRPDFLSFVPTVEVFFDRHPPDGYDGAERRHLAEIQALEAPRREVTEMMRRMDLSVLKMQLANLARQLDWIDAEEHESIATDGLKELLAEPLSTEVADIGCELSKYTPAGGELTSEEVPDQLFWHAEGYRLVDCLKPADPRLTPRMVVGLDNIDEATRLWATYALYRRRPLDDEVLISMAPRLADNSAEVRDMALRTFEMESPLSPPVLTAVRERAPGLADSLVERE